MSQEKRVGVSACRRVGVSACRRIGVVCEGVPASPLRSKGGPGQAEIVLVLVLVLVIDLWPFVRQWEVSG